MWTKPEQSKRKRPIATLHLNVHVHVPNFPHISSHDCNYYATPHVSSNTMRKPEMVTVHTQDDRVFEWCWRLAVVHREQDQLSQPDKEDSGMMRPQASKVTFITEKISPSNYKAGLWRRFQSKDANLKRCHLLNACSHVQSVLISWNNTATSFLRCPPPIVLSPLRMRCVPNYYLQLSWPSRTVLCEERGTRGAAPSAWSLRPLQGR